MPTTEAEEFEFRMRAEQEAGKAAPVEEPGLVGQQEFFGFPKDSPKTASPVQAVKDWFNKEKSQDVTSGEVIGDVTGQALGGSVAAVVLPELMQKGGKLLSKVPFGPAKAIGNTTRALGEVLGDIPAGERSIQGAGGGALQSGAELTAKATGMAPIYSVPLSLGAGGLGEAGASFLTKEGGKLGAFALKAMQGDANGAINAVKGMISPYKELNAKSAARMQERMFGKKVEDRVDHLTSSDHRIAVQEKLRKDDPTLVTGFARKPEEATASAVPGTNTAMSGSTDLATTAFSKPRMPQLGGPKALPGPAGAKGSKDWIGKALEQRRADAARAAEEQAKQALRPASDIYRERMFDGITQAIQAGKPFSTSAAGQEFAKKLEVLVQSRELTAPQREKLLGTLRSDRNPSASVQKRYAQNLDDQIRMWGKPAEKGGQEGAAAIPARIAKEVRENLREAVNKYAEGVGLGKVESQYRNAYKQEMLAEAKDVLPHYLTFSDTTEFEKVARNLASDPSSKPVIQQVLGQHLASVPPANIGKEFLRLQNVLVKAELLAPVEMRELRLKAQDISRVNDKGVQLAAYQRLQRMLLTNMSRKVMGAGGGAVGAAALD